MAVKCVKKGGGEGGVNSLILWKRLYAVTLTVLVAGVGARALQAREVLRQDGQVGVGGAIVVLRVWRLLHHLLDLLDHLPNKRSPVHKRMADAFLRVVDFSSMALSEGVSDLLRVHTRGPTLS